MRAVAICWTRSMAQTLGGPTGAVKALFAPAASARGHRRWPARGVQASGSPRTRGPRFGWRRWPNRATAASGPGARNCAAGTGSARTPHDKHGFFARVPGRNQAVADLFGQLQRSCMVRIEDAVGRLVRQRSISPCNNSPNRFKRIALPLCLCSKGPADLRHAANRDHECPFEIGKADLTKKSSRRLVTDHPVAIAEMVPKPCI